MTPLLVLCVLGAGVVGALLRYGVSLAFASRSGFPLAVLTVNVVASTIGGVTLGLADRAAISADVRLVLLTGLCGGLSTFSTWSVESVQLMQAGRWRAAVTSVGLNLVVALGFAALGYVLAR
jgi:CrcB protein